MTESTTTRLLVVALAIALVGAVFAGGSVMGQQADDGPDQQTSYLRVIHASPDAPPVDVYVNNETALTNVSFGDVSDYMALPAGEYDVTVTAAGDPDAVVLDGSLTLQARTASTVAVAGEATSDPPTLQSVRYIDDAFTPGEEESAISVFHLSPDAPAVDVTAGNGTVVLADNVSFTDATDYRTVPAGDYTVEIREESESNNGTVVATADVTLEGGTAYSALALGYLNPDEAAGNESFQVSPTEDASMTIQLPAEEPIEPPVATETPDGNETPEATETPEETPAATETPEANETPTETQTEVPVTTETPEGTEGPEATETPTATETGEDEETAVATDTPEADGTA